MGGSFQTLYSYLDLRLDYMLTRLNFVPHIFEARRLIDSGVIRVDNRVIFTNDYILKPFQRVSVLTNLREEWKEKFFANMIIQRTQNVNTRPLPRFIEPNWALFSFMLLPLFNRESLYRPMRTKNLHVGGGKHQPEKVS